LKNKMATPSGPSNPQAPNLTFNFYDVPSDLPSPPSSAGVPTPVLAGISPPTATTTVTKPKIIPLSQSQMDAKHKKQLTYVILAALGVLILALVIWALVRHHKSGGGGNSPSSAAQVSQGSQQNPSETEAQKRKMQIYREALQRRAQQMQQQQGATCGAARAATQGVASQVVTAACPAQMQAGQLVQYGYSGNGPLRPNTYTYTVLAPKVGPTTSGIFESLQPSQTVIQEFAGAFLPEVRNPRC